MRLPLLLASLALAACSSAPARYLSEESEAALISDTHSLDEWELTLDEAADLVRVLPTSQAGDWFGEGDDGEGTGSLTKGRLRLQGTWSGGKLEGPFVGYYRGLLLINGHAEGGVPIDGTLYQHVVFNPIYSSSWTDEHIQFVLDQGGTHSLMAFSGLFKDGEPHRGRFGTVDDNFRVTSYVEGTWDKERLFQGTYSRFELAGRFDAGGSEYGNLEPMDSDYKLVLSGKLADGLREGHWGGPKLDAIYLHGKREGFCRRRVGVRDAIGEFDYAWLSANVRGGQASRRHAFDVL